MVLLWRGLTWHFCTIHMFVYNNKSKGANNRHTYVSEHIANKKKKKKRTNFMYANYIVITNQLNQTHLNHTTTIIETVKRKRRKTRNRTNIQWHYEVCVYMWIRMRVKETKCERWKYIYEQDAFSIVEEKKKKNHTSFLPFTCK